MARGVVEFSNADVGLGALRSIAAILGLVFQVAFASRVGRSSVSSTSCRYGDGGFVGDSR